MSKSIQRQRSADDVIENILYSMQISLMASFSCDDLNGHCKSSFLVPTLLADEGTNG